MPPTADNAGRRMFPQVRAKGAATAGPQDASHPWPLG